MSARRSLAEGLKTTEKIREAEEFVFAGKVPAAEAESPPPAAAVAASSPTLAGHGRTPLTTRVRADIAEALKRASLSRQLAGVTPNTVQEILDEALEPWMKANGYLP